MKIEWDPVKARTNLKKHGVRFADAEAVLFDPAALSSEDETAEDEQRYAAIGLDHLRRILVVIYTYRGGNIRLISARPATRRERHAYENRI